MTMLSIFSWLFQTLISSCQKLENLVGLFGQDLVDAKGEIVVGKDTIDLAFLEYMR